MNWKAAFVFVACAAAVLAQTPPVSILEIDIEDAVLYVDDLGDPSRIASSPATSTLPGTYNRVFKWVIAVGDIVAVNGKPAKGLWVVRSIAPRYTATYTPGRAIADIDGNCAQDAQFSILQADGTPVGTIVAMGLGGTAPPPGAPTVSTAHDMVVVGGSGPFLGVRGYRGVVRSAGRYASMIEDPANRRLNRGGSRREILHLIPMTWPEVVTLSTGPAIFHGDDFSAVTAEKPARAGEWLTLSASGLGPVLPNLGPGKPFPAWEPGKEYQVNSPLEVTVGGKAAEVRNAIGWPGQTNVYRVDFRVPEGTTTGTATLGLSVAWINGPEVKIPVR